MNEVEVGVLINRVWNNETGKLYLTFEIVDSVATQYMRQDNINVKLIAEEEENANL